MKKTIADKIRSLNDEQLAKFLWWFSIHQTSSFFDDEIKGMNAREIKTYLAKDEANWIDFAPKEELL
jgi:hypothetical protein